MKNRRAAMALVGLLSLLISSGACVSGRASGGGESGGANEPAIVGLVTQEEILSRTPTWVGELVDAAPDETQAKRLAEPVADTEVVVFFGSWCSDSRRELTRLWRAVEMAGGEFGFPIRYIGVDRSKTEPSSWVDGVDLLYVPTLIVKKKGLETGRIVESSPAGVERDLADLVAGDASGWLSGRDDLGMASAPAAKP